MNKFFTSESVTEGHPDKICDQISDAVLDAILAKDPYARVACETSATTGLVLVMGEITTNCYVDIQSVARNTIRRIGYDRAKYGFDCDTCAVLTAIHEQSADIAMGVDDSVEHRAGGDEAALFTAEICRMYIKYAESRGWKTELTSADENGIGGFKDATLLINGAGAYSRMKYESGTHRVQRVPETESGGRIHTSTMTVAIMPEVDDVEVQIDPKDYKFDVFRASGNGGQCVNTTDSAVRLTHFPSGIVISCQDEKSQLKNKDKALKILRARLYDLEQQKQHDEMAELRKSQVGTGDRSEKIRTYNFPQGRVTDHRIKLTLYKLDAIMNGDLDEIIDSLIAADQAAKLSSMQEEA